VIELPGGIAETNLAFSKSGNDLVITVGSLGTVTVNNEFYGSAGSYALNHPFLPIKARLI
jgi:hypothetical protein